MKPFRILDEALAELEAASIWYEEQGEGLGADLLTEFRERLEEALELPDSGSSVGLTPGGNEIRRFRLNRFKRYALLMSTILGESTVLAFQHSSRRPGYWRNRL